MRTDPILLVGPQRSGTTALAGALSEALAAAGGCFTINGKLLYFLRRWWMDTDADGQHLRSDEVSHSLRRIPAQGAGAAAWLERAHTALLASARRAAGHGTELSARDEIRRICWEAYGASQWGDKYNEYLLDLGWLHATFPDARWIFLVRDPGETVASMLAWKRDKPWNPEGGPAASAKWADWTSRWLGFRDALPHHRRVELDYAELCAGRHRTLSEVVGVDLGPFLTNFRRPTHERPSAPLCPAAHAVRRQLVHLGILSGHRDQQPG